MSGEVLARWQDFAGAGDVLQSLQSRRGSRQRRHRAPAKAQALKMAARAAVESLIISAADRAAEDCLARWRSNSAGAALLDHPGSDGSTAAWQSEFAAEAGLIFGWESEEPGAANEGLSDPQARIAALGRSSPDLATHAAQAVSAWQDQVTRLVEAENVTKRSIAKAVSLDNDSLATVLIVSLFGAGPLRDIMARTGADLRHRIALLLDEEMRRFADVIDVVGTPDAAASLNLYQATYALEVAR